MGEDFTVSQNLKKLSTLFFNRLLYILRCYISRLGPIAVKFRVVQSSCSLVCGAGVHMAKPAYIEDQRN